MLYEVITGTSSPAGANRIAESASAGISSGFSPAHTAPIRFASARCSFPRVQTKTEHPRYSASCIV